MATENVHQTMLMVLLSLVVGALLISLVIFVSDSSALENSRCEKSIEAYAQLLSHGIRSSDRELALAKDTINCPYERVSLKRGEEAKKQVADELATCWSNYGEGELNLYGRNEGVFCSICSIVIPKEDVEGIFSYLNERVYVKEKQTYAEYLTGKQFETNYGEPMMLKDESYGVFFVYTKGVDSLQLYQDRLDGYVGNAFLFSAGTAGLLINPKAAPFVMYRGASGFVSQALFYEEPYDTSAQVLLMPFSEEVLTETLGCTRVPVEVLDG